MALIEWNPDFSVGIGEMDRQHQKLISLINQFHNALKAGKGDEMAKGILVQLAEYTQSHFVAEEQLMARYGFPEYHAHKKLHTELIAQVGQMVSKVKAGKMVSPVSIAAFLKEWLNTHIIGADKLYGHFITMDSCSH